jgi:hypothetical protein
MVSATALAIAERELHNRIGALIAESSHFAPRVVEAILQQHEPAEGRKLIDIVAAADGTARVVVRALAGARAELPEAVLESLVRLRVPYPKELVTRAVNAVRALRA